MFLAVEALDASGLLDPFLRILEFVEEILEVGTRTTSLRRPNFRRYVGRTPLS